MEFLSRAFDYLLGEGRIVRSAPLAFACLLLLGIGVGFWASEFRSGAKIDALEGAVAQYQATLAAPPARRIIITAHQPNKLVSDLYVFLPGCGVGLLLGWLLRKRRTNKPLDQTSPQIEIPERQWMYPSTAVATFSAEENATIEHIETELDKAKQTADDLWKKARENNTDSKSFSDAGTFGVMQRLTELRAAATQASTRHRDIANQLEAEKTRRFVKFRMELEEGRYIAQGYLPLRAPGSSPVEIPKEEWRLLYLDQDAPLMDRALGNGIEYIGVRVAKAN